MLAHLRHPLHPVILQQHVRANHHHPRNLHHRRHLRRRLRRHRPPHGHRVGLHPFAVGDHHALRRLPRSHRTAQALLGSHCRRHRLQPRLHPRLLARSLGRTPGHRTLWPLHPPQPPRPRPHRALLPEIRRHHGPHRPPPASSSNLHRPTRRHRPHAATPLPPLHLHRLLALVLRAGLRRHEVRRQVGNRSSLQG